MAKYVVRYGVMRLLGIFTPNAGAEFTRDTRVIVRTDRGLESGEVRCEATEAALDALADVAEGQILRAMTAEDLRELARMQDQAHREMETCEQYVRKLNLSMQLVEVEHLFGGERVVVYYLAESRVDFRELVKLLASEFQTRIEMRQIGVRDEAKLLADYGDCGLPCCCNTHLIVMPPVSMRMAKLQKATLDPNKISGRCGRLKCCLRYEYDAYEEAEKASPAPRRPPPRRRAAWPRSNRRATSYRLPPTKPLWMNTMLDPSMIRLLEEDRRYPLEAYIFVFEALTYAQTVLGMGSEIPSETLDPDDPLAAAGEEEEEEDEGEEGVSQRHVTGQELCEAIRTFALEQYGYMAKTVLNNWGIHATGDFGEIVFNLIRIGRMRKTADDHREDFDEVYDFDAGFQQAFRFAPPECRRRDREQFD